MRVGTMTENVLAGPWPDVDRPSRSGGEADIGPDVGPRAQAWEGWEHAAASRAWRAAPDPAALIRFESSAPGHPAYKTKAVRKAFGCSLTLYTHWLLKAAETREGMRADIVTCLRLLQERDAKRDARRRAGHLREVGA